MLRKSITENFKCYWKIQVTLRTKKIWVFISLLKMIKKVVSCCSSSHLNRNIIPSTGAPCRTMVASKRIFSRLRLMAICFLYLGSQLSNMEWLSTNRFRSSKSFAWNSCNERLYKSLLTMTKSVFSSAMIVAFRIQSAFIKASSPKLRPASVYKKSI